MAGIARGIIGWQIERGQDSFTGQKSLPDGGGAAAKKWQ
jgi:hypothetical protein